VVPEGRPVGGSVPLGLVEVAGFHEPGQLASGLLDLIGAGLVGVEHRLGGVLGGDLASDAGKGQQVRGVVDTAEAGDRVVEDLPRSDLVHGLLEVH